MRKVLHSAIVIDDDCISLFLITKMLGDLSLTESILSFTNGINALNFFRNSAEDFFKLPEIILVDIKMPNINGWEFLHELSKINFIAGYTPVVFVMSADTCIDVDMPESQPWVKGCFVKPIMPDKLITLFNSLPLRLCWCSLPANNLTHLLPLLNNTNSG
jgi:CheY-like chemotaxis protein